MDLVSHEKFRRFVINNKLRRDDFNTINSLRKKINEITDKKRATYNLLPDEIENYEIEPNLAAKTAMETKSKGKLTYIVFENINIKLVN